MALIIILIVLGIRQMWEDRNPLHQDAWFTRWHTSLSSQAWLDRYPRVVLVLSVGLPALAVLCLMLLLHPVLKVLLAVVVLTYSLGRGQYNDVFLLYRSAVNGRRWDDAKACLDDRPAPPQAAKTPLAPEDWDSLHQRMLLALGYQGFERLFAVLFWFLVSGPAGALLYRLSVQSAALADLDEDQQGKSLRWLWALEWIPARLLAISFCITGNFVGCANKLSSVIFNTGLSSAKVIQQAVLGSLSLDDVEVESDIVTVKEIAALKQLLARTLWLWLAVLAVYLLFTGT